MSAPQKPPHCTMCGGPNVSPSTRFRSQNTNVGVTMEFDNNSIRVGRARTCLDCGYVMLFLDDFRLAELRQGLANGMRPVAPDIKDD